MTTPTPNPNEGKGLTPDVLAEQLFDVAFTQNPSDPRGAARQAIDFLAAALYYALTKTKHDVVVYLTETLIHVISANATDEKSRKEMLKYVGDTITNAEPPAVPSAAPPGAPAAKPTAGKP